MWGETPQQETPQQGLGLPPRGGLAGEAKALKEAPWDAAEVERLPRRGLNTGPAGGLPRNGCSTPPSGVGVGSRVDTWLDCTDGLRKWPEQRLTTVLLLPVLLVLQTSSMMEGGAETEMGLGLTDTDGQKPGDLCRLGDLP